MALQSTTTLLFVVVAITCFLLSSTTGFVAKQATPQLISSFQRVSSDKGIVPFLSCSTDSNIGKGPLATPLEEGKFVNEFPPPQLVVMLPAFNEFKRIGETLDTYQMYLNESVTWRNRSRILVVDDGSDDGTADLVGNFIRGDDTVPVDCVSLVPNQGKGAAVSFGIRHLVELYDNEPCLVLIADADGSGDITCLNNMTSALGTLIASSSTLQSSNESFWITPAIMNGYRGYNGSSLLRSILRWGFRTSVFILCGDLRVRDSQCGFKLMTLAAARQVYADLNLKRWSHDVEVLYRARECNVPIDEQTVPWQDKEGSKLVNSSAGTLEASVIMFMEVMQMRLEYALGRWKLPIK